MKPWFALPVVAPAGSLDRGTARFTSTCTRKRSKRALKKIRAKTQKETKKLDQLNAYHFAVDRVLLDVAHFHRAVLHLEDDETEAPGLVSLSVEHHLRGNYSAILLEIRSKFS